MTNTKPREKKAPSGKLEAMQAQRERAAEARAEALAARSRERSGLDEPSEFASEGSASSDGVGSVSSEPAAQALPAEGAEILGMSDDTLDVVSARTLKGALEAVSQGSECAATDTLVEHLDDLFLAGKFDVARRLLVQLDPQRLPPNVLSGVLMVSRVAKAALGDERIAFLERVRVALSETWRLSPAQVEAICRRHA